MTSIRARLVNLALPLLGVKRFFAQREKLRADEVLQAKLRSMANRPKPRRINQTA